MEILMTATNPVLVEVTRGSIVESRHRGAISVMDGDGAVVVKLGDTARPVFPRSAVKSIQALPLIESGAADAFGFGNAELALACSSHSGEDEHIAMASGMLERAGRSESDLECGGQWSSHEHVLIHQARNISGQPGALCNNCSGKHSAFVCTAVHAEIDPHNYIRADHPIMCEVKAVLENVTGAAHDEDLCGIDGCSIPTYAVPLSSLAHGFAKMTTGNGLSPERAEAARRLFDACMAEPFYVAGRGRFCTRLMELGQGRIFVKTGAEGVFCGAIPELGVGIALKCDDGTTRAAEIMMVATLCHLLPPLHPLHRELTKMATITLKNRNGWEVGEIRASLPV